MKHYTIPIFIPEQGKYKPLNMEEAVDRIKQILPLFEKAGVKVLRVGLHPSEGLLSGDELVAGPFHPSFKRVGAHRNLGGFAQAVAQNEKAGQYSYPGTGRSTERCHRPPGKKQEDAAEDIPVCEVWGG